MRITRWGGAAILGAAVALAVGSSAAAQDVSPAAEWQHRQIATGDPDWSDATAGGITGPTTVDLTKPDPTTGTSLETADLGLPVAAGDTITVQYELLDGALPDAGAVRLFWYDTPNADTLTVAPTAFVAADGMSGTLSIEIAAEAQVGTLGLVYDASNASTGTVRFSDLTVAGAAVLFEAPADPDPSPSPTLAPDPDPEPTEDPAPGKGGGQDELPKTGSPLLVLGAAGAGLGVVGGGLAWLGRRRRVTV